MFELVGKYLKKLCFSSQNLYWCALTTHLPFLSNVQKLSSKILSLISFMQFSISPGETLAYCLNISFGLIPALTCFSIFCLVSLSSKNRVLKSDVFLYAEIISCLISLSFLPFLYWLKTCSHSVWLIPNVLNADASLKRLLFFCPWTNPYFFSHHLIKYSIIKFDY